MVSGGVKVVVKSGRILKQDLPTKINPFVRIKAGNRIADSRQLSLSSIKQDISWNQSLSIIFKQDTQLMIQLLDADKNIPNYHYQIGICILDLEILQISQKQNIFGIFHNNTKLAALIDLQITYQTMLQQKIQKANVDAIQNSLIRKAETEIFYQQQELVYQKLSLHFKVIQATLIHNTQAIGDMKPYCLIKIDYKEFKTDILKGKNPKWNQLFIFQDVKPHITIDLSVWDKESMKKDDFVGRGTITVGAIMSQQSKVFQINLTYQDMGITKPAGTIKIQASIK